MASREITPDTLPPEASAPKVQHIAWLEAYVTEQRVAQLAAAAKAGDANAARVAAISYAELMEFQPDKLNAPEAVALKQASAELPEVLNAIALGVGVYKGPGAAISAVKDMPGQAMQAVKDVPRQLQSESDFVHGLASSNANPAQKVGMILSHNMAPITNRIISALPLGTANKDSSLNREQQLALAGHYRESSGFDRKVEHYTNVAANVDLTIASMVAGPVASRLTGGGINVARNLIGSENVLATENGLRLESDVAAVSKVSDKAVISGQMTTTATTAAEAKLPWVAEFSEAETRSVRPELVAAAKNYLSTLAQGSNLNLDKIADQSALMQAQHEYEKALKYTLNSENRTSKGINVATNFATTVRDRELLTLAKASAGSEVDSIFSPRISFSENELKELSAADYNKTFKIDGNKNHGVAVITQPTGERQLVLFNEVTRDNAEGSLSLKYLNEVTPINRDQIDTVIKALEKKGIEGNNVITCIRYLLDINASAESNNKLATAVNHLDNPQSREIVTAQINANARLAALEAVNVTEAGAQLNA